MKYLFLLATILIATLNTNAQQVTRGQLMNMYYKAQKAEKANDMQGALSIYKSILQIDSSLPTPYLKIADIYSTDETNVELLGLALAYYEKFQKLQPDYNDAKSINEKIIHLKGKLSENNKNPVEVQIEQIEPQPKSNIEGENITKEEVVVIPEELKVNTLWEKAHKALDNNDIELASALLKEVTNNTSPNIPLFAQANILLANIYGKSGDVIQMKEAIDALESCVSIQEQVLTDIKSTQKMYDVAVKNATPFEEDLCGVWITDYSSDIDGLPYIVLEISKNKNDNSYSIQILPYCTLAHVHNMYEGKPFNWVMKPMDANSKNKTYLALSTDYAVYGHSDKAGNLSDNALLFFGAEKYKSGSPLAAKMGIQLTGELGKGIKESINYNVKNPNAKNQIQNAEVDFAVLLISGFFANMAVHKSTIVTLNMDIKRKFAGCTSLKYEEKVYIERSDGAKPAPQTSTQNMILYKLYPSDNIQFATKDGELFGWKQFSKDEIKNSGEKDIPKATNFFAMKGTNDIKEFNRNSYLKLKDKVTSLAKNLFSNSQNASILEDINQSFDFATKGLSYQTIENEKGSYTGWMDNYRKLNGWGSCVLKSGYRYVGEWKNNKHSGTGKLNIPNIGIYSGIFENGKFQNTGILTYNNGDKYEGNFNKGKKEGSGKYTCSNKIIFDGIWKADNPLKGKITYPNGDIYEGECDYNRKENRFEKRGLGVLIYSDGKKVEGKWNSDKLIE
jgi:tetratricopeptide (TPR) repeat protein